FKSTVFVVFFTGLWPTLFNTQAGILSLEAQYTDVAKVYLADRSFYIRHVVLPGSLPFILTGLRLTYGVGWRVIVGAELISSITGLGFMLDDARWQLRPDILVMGMGVIAVIGWSVDRYFFGTLERATLQKWGMQSRTV
ncbi:MAG: ABC transporter permease subunit, partial [Candidatus Binatia bacterium]